MPSTTAPSDQYGPPNPRVAIVIHNELGKELAADAVRSSGGIPILLTSLADMPSVCEVCVGTVCDLAPWDEEAIDEFREVRRAAPHDLFVLYVPQAKKELVAPLDTADPGVRCHVQDPSPKGLMDFQNDVAWMINSGASSTLIAIILANRSPVNPTALQFLWWAVRSVGKKRRGPVAEAAESIGVSTRTLARRLHYAGLPTPLELYGWVQLLAVAWTAERTDNTIGRAGRAFHLNPMRLFQLKTRLLKHDLLASVRTSKIPMSIVVKAFRQRCVEIRPPPPGDSLPFPRQSGS